jgi:hypothetical protein
MDYITPQTINKLSKKNGTDPENSQFSSGKNMGQEIKPAVEDTFPDYPPYPPDEDIYTNYTKEGELDPEQPSRLKEPVILSNLINMLDFEKELSGEGLDVPGSELDDEQERIGSEDEENNYYSLGGDNHEEMDATLGQGI